MTMRLSDTSFNCVDHFMTFEIARKNSKILKLDGKRDDVPDWVFEHGTGA